MAKKTKAAAAAPVETITAYKGFTDALTCTGGDTPFQRKLLKPPPSSRQFEPSQAATWLAATLPARSNSPPA